MRDLVDELLQAKVKATLFGGDHAPRLDRLVLLDRIGSGAMGTVFAAYDPRLDRKVAVKIVRARGAEANARVLAEARALGKLAHPNVVAIHDAGEIDDAIYIVMELAPGVSLRTWFAGSNDWRDVVRVLREAATGLAAAHRAGLIHRDIKPDNILVGDDRTRVVDFGLAHDRATGEDTTSAGTPSYMAPEQLADEAATEASDQFAFGVTLFEALYGVRPHTGATRDELKLTALSAYKVRAADALKSARSAPTPRATGATVDVGAETAPADEPENPTAKRATAGEPANAAAETASAGEPANAAAKRAPDDEPANAAAKTADESANAASKTAAADEPAAPVRPSSAPVRPSSRSSSGSSGSAGTTDERPGSPHRAPPTWVHDVVVRALAPVPSNRFPSMDALAAALGRDRRRQRMIALAAVAALAGAAVGVGAYRSQARGGDPCTGGAARRAGVWNPTTTAAVRAALGDAPWAARAVATLDARGTAWEASYRRVCAASRVSGAQSDTLLDLRMRCLDRALDRMGALSTAIATPPPTDEKRGPTPLSGNTAKPGDTEKGAPTPISATDDKGGPPPVSGALSTATRVDAVAAIHELPNPVACESMSDAAELALPTDPGQRAQVTTAERELDRAWSSYALGRYGKAAAEVLAIEERTATLEAPALRAAVLLLAATVEGRTGKPAAGRARLDQALAAAAAAHTPAIELDVWSRLLRHELFAGNSARVIEWDAFAHAAAVRAGRDGGELDGIIGEAHRDLGHLDAARDRLRRALASKDSLRPVQRALIEMNVGSVELAAGDLGAAEAAFTRAFDLAHGALGDGHPTIALYLDKLASTDRARGRIGAALARHGESLALRTAAYGAADRSLATSLVQRGRTYIEAGTIKLAIADLAEAAHIRAKAYGESSPRLAEVVLAGADADTAAGDATAARRQLDRAVELDPSLATSVEVIVRRIATGEYVAVEKLPATLDPFSVDRVAALTARVGLVPREQATPLAAALLARWRTLGPGAHPALSLAIAQALRASGDRVTAATVAEAALRAIGDEPTRTKLALIRELAFDSDGPAAEAARAQAAQLAAQLPELPSPVVR